MYRRVFLLLWRVLTENQTVDLRVFLSISLKDKLEKWTMSLGGSLLNSSFLDLYFKSRQASFESSTFLSSLIFSVISVRVLFILSSSFFRTVRWLSSVFSISVFSLLITSSISLCQSHLRLLRVVINCSVLPFKSVFWSRIVDAISWYLG